MQKTKNGNIQESGSVNFAGFWIRFVATWIDTFVIVVPLIVLVYILSAGAWFDMDQSMQMVELDSVELLPKTGLQWELLFELLIAGVTIFFWKKWAGATPGKKLLNIHVVDAKSYGAIDNKQAIIRYVGYFISTIPLGLGFVMAAFHKEKRTLHDILAGTVVIYNK